LFVPGRPVGFVIYDGNTTSRLKTLSKVAEIQLTMLDMMDYIADKNQIDTLGR